MSKVIRNTSGKSVRKGLAFATASSLAISMATGAQAQDADTQVAVEDDDDVIIVTGDHSTPSFLKSHSWHPVPTLLFSNCCRPDRCEQFSESESVLGGLGQFQAKHLMTLALANAGRLGKYGA